MMKPTTALFAGYIVGICLIAAAVLEIGMRYRLDLPITAWRDWRGVAVTVLQTGGANYDAHLGWTQKPNLKSGEFNTLDYGIRRNSPNDENLAGATLAVGNSYTAGSEVSDAETWPAFLERKIHGRVLNAGVGGYGVDQTALNAERLIEILKPHTVIVGIFEEDIARSGYRSYGAPKPYFEKDGAEWVLRNQPVPTTAHAGDEPLYRRALARFIVPHMVLQKFAYDWWFSVGARRFERAANDPSKLSCFLLQRLSQKLHAYEARGLVVFQFPGWAYARNKPAESGTTRVMERAKAAGFVVIDERQTMTPIASTIADLQSHYVSNGGSYGHMSAKGNDLIATMISAKLVPQ